MKSKIFDNYFFKIVYHFYVHRDWFYPLDQGELLYDIWQYSIYDDWDECWDEDDLSHQSSYFNEENPRDCVIEMEFDPIEDLSEDNDIQTSMINQVEELDIEQHELHSTDDEWDYIWSTMIENGAWAVPSIKDETGAVIKENYAPEIMIKFIAHELKCNIIVFDLQLDRIQFISGNHIMSNNVIFDSPLLLYLRNWQSFPIVKTQRNSTQL